MTAPTEPAPDSASPTRGERMARDVMHTLLIDSKPWVEIQANRREVIRASFENLDAADDFEGMLAAQMAIVHSIFLGTAWLSLDRARPEKDKAFYLRQAGQLMRLYRQGFDSLGKRQRERRALQEREKALRYFRGNKKPTGESKRGHAIFQEKVACPPDAESTGELDRGVAEVRGHSTLLRKAECPRSATPETQLRGEAAAIIHSTFKSEPVIASRGPATGEATTLRSIPFPTPPHRKQRLMASAGPVLAQGP